MVSKFLNVTACQYCKKDGKAGCFKSDDVFKLVCTRPKGHEGPHVACAINDHYILEWENTNGK
jgi:hypothetical protein